MITERHVITAMLTLSVAAILVVGAFIAIEVSHLRQIKAEHIKDCKKLDARYAQVYRVKDGPYRDVDMLAVSFGDTDIVLVTAYGSDQTKRRFRCGELFQPETE